MKKDEKLILWTERLQAFQASGQTCREWCREHQIPVSTMTVSAKYCYVTHELRLHQNDRCKRFTLF